MALAIRQPRSQIRQSCTDKLIESALLVAILLVATNVCAQQQVGYVQDIDSNGHWLLNNSRHLTLGQALPSGGIITNPSPSADDHIAIADLHGNLIEKRNCTSASCNSSINLPRRANKGPSDYFSVVLGGV